MLHKKRKINGDQSTLRRQNASRDLTSLNRQSKNSTAENILKRQKAMRDLNLAQATLRRARANAIANASEVKVSTSKQSTPRLAELKRDKAVRDLHALSEQNTQKSDALKPAELRRSKATPHLPGLESGTNTNQANTSETQARRERANAIADLRPYTPPTISNPPALTRSNASRDLTKAGEAVNKTKKPKRDITTGRLLFPVTDGGKTRYLPVESEANPHERKLGLFVSNASIKKDPVNTLSANGKSIRELVSQNINGDEIYRTLFATENADGKTEYLPKESEATAGQLNQGKYVPDDQVENPPKGNTIVNGEGNQPLWEFNEQRILFATETADGKREYLPKRSEATAAELQAGNYVNDEDISEQAPLGKLNSMSNEKPRYDPGKERTVFPVKTKDGKVIYLPDASSADAFERARGLYIPDDIVDKHERKRRRTGLKDYSADQDQLRAQRAKKLAGGATGNTNQITEPITEATDGTAIWDGFTLPQISEQRQSEVLQTLKAKYDLGKGRMVYPTETAKGKIEYLPLLSDATTDERIDQRYVAFVPLQPLEDFLQDPNNGVQQKTFDTEQGQISGYAQEDVNQAFSAAPQLVLRSARLVTEAAQQNPALQQTRL